MPSRPGRALRWGLAAWWATTLGAAQQAYTNLVRWIIELYRVLPGGWVTLRDVYHCAIDKELFAKKIQQAQTYAADMSDTWITIAATEMKGEQLTPLRGVGFQPHPADRNRFRARAEPATRAYLKQHKITHARERIESTSAQEIRLRVEAVHRWYVHDRMSGSALVGVSRSGAPWPSPSRVQLVSTDAARCAASTPVPMASTCTANVRARRRSLTSGMEAGPIPSPMLAWHRSTDPQRRSPLPTRLSTPCYSQGLDGRCILGWATGADTLYRGSSKAT